MVPELLFVGRIWKCFAGSVLPLEESMANPRVNNELLLCLADNPTLTGCLAAVSWLLPKQNTS